MVTKLENIIISILVLILISLTIIFAVSSTNKMNEKQDVICNKMAEDLGLEFLEATHGECGWGEACNFQCRLLNSKGEVVIKNYP